MVLHIRMICSMNYPELRLAAHFDQGTMSNLIGLFNKSTSRDSF